MGKSATSGQTKVDNGSSNSRQVHVSSFPRPSLSHVLLPDKFRLVVTRDIVVFPKISLRATLRTLVCTAEALIMSGITNLYELYKHMHPSHLGNCVGSGMGGSESLAGMFSDRRLEKPVQSDILQET
jgi:hypothetical protein